MKAEIKNLPDDSEGILFIERAGILQQTFCPFNISEGCGDWCSLFGDPVKIPSGNGKPEVTILNLCHSTLTLDNFQDLRD